MQSHAIDALRRYIAESMAQAQIALTFKLDTRSAVSNRVNVEIWSTICAILGLIGAAAASVDSHRR